MKPIAAAFILALAIAFVGPTDQARAGLHSTQPLAMDFVNLQASGGMRAVRNMNDQNSQISCIVLAPYGATAISAFCFAADQFNRTISCLTSNRDMIQALNSLGGDSFLEFQSDATGQCTKIGVRNASYDLP